jgi:hypothetical protein
MMISAATERNLSATTAIIGRPDISNNALLRPIRWLAPPANMTPVTGSGIY